MSRINWIKKWIDEGLVNEGLLPEQIEILSDKDMYLCKDIGDTDSVIDMLIYEYHDYETWNDFNYSKLSVIKENYESCDRELKIAVSLKNWEFERDLINFLKDQEKSAVKKNKIETDFLYFEKLFYPNFEDIKIEIDSDGINYLSAPENVDKNELNSVIVNCSFSELKKLYNLTGVKLFKSNVRNGITNKKSEIKTIFNNYMEWDEDSDSNSVKYRDYDSKLFWFSHNGITLFVDNDNNNNFTFSDNIISINPKSCSIINGAQTITNFFLAYSEKKHQFKNSPEDLNKLEELIKNINVKLTIISGKSEYSPFITKGLNTQNPITIVDFAAISKEVQSLNEAFQEKLEILKTGEVTKKNGVSPLEFVKKYYLVKEEPGKSKNFNKNNLSKALVEITDLILEERNGKYQLKESEELIVDKILFLSKIEKWWFWKNKSLGEKKTVLNTYGKNYFQSYVIHFYDVIIDADFEEFIDQIYLDFEKLLNDIETEKENNKVQKISYNVFKTDEWYKKMLFLLAKDTKRTLIDKNITESPEKGIENEGITKEINNVNEKIDDKEYNQKLLNYLKTNNKKPYQLMIIEFNKMNHYEFDNVRVIRRVNNRIKENFHLSVKTFSSIYSNIDMSEKIKNNEEFLEFPSFNNSVLKEELSKKYNLVIIDIENDIEQNVTLLQNFQFELINSNLSEVEQLYNETIKAFIEGDISLFPKANKENCIHVRTKAIDKDDTFLFTNGEWITKRTFWITRYYIEDYLKNKKI